MDDHTRRSSGMRGAARNTAWLMAGQLLSKVASVVFVVIVARAIGVREYGYFTFATSFVPLFLAFGTLGLDSAVVREVSRDRSRLSELFASGLFMRLAIGVLALILSLLLAPLFVDESAALVTVLVVGAALFVDEVTTYISTVFKAFEQMRFHAATLVVNRILSTAASLMAYLAGAGLMTITVTYLAGSLAALFYAVRSLRLHFPSIDVRQARRTTAASLLRRGVPLGIAGVLNMALFRLDSVMVEAFDGIAAVGLYGVAFRFFESFLFVSWSLGNVTLPRYARDGAGARSARTFDVAVSASLSFYVPLTVGSAFAARWVVQLVFGARYADAADAVPWLTLAAALYAVTYQARTAVIGVGGRSSIAWVAALALTINVSANLVLIPRHGFVGAAMATALACGVEAVLTTVAVRRAGVTVRVSRVVAVPLTAGAVMAAALAGFGLAGAAAAVVGAAVYLVALAGAAVMLAPAERQTVLGLLRRPRVRPGVLDAPAG